MAPPCPGCDLTSSSPPCTVLPSTQDAHLLHSHVHAHICRYVLTQVDALTLSDTFGPVRTCTR